MNELADALEADGFTASDLKAAVSNGQLRSFREVILGHAEIVMKKVEETITQILTFISTVAIAAVPAKKTADCFTNKSRYYYRDPNMGSWLPQNQPGQPKSKFSIQQLSQPATFKQAVESFLGQTGDIKTLARLLKERGAVTTLTAIESLVERQESGENVDLRTDGRANFFFIENKNKDDAEEGCVSVVYAYRIDGQWRVRVIRLGYGGVWSPGYRFFFRNSDTVSL